MNRQRASRVGIYLVGLLLNSLGATFSSKSGLGTFAVLSVPYGISLLWGLSFANLVLAFNAVLAVGEYSLKGKFFRLYDLLQVPMAFLFSRGIALFTAWVPDVEALPLRIACLLLGILCTGFGVALMVDMRLLPLPADGLVQVISDRTGKELGFCKNCLDAVCLAGIAILGLCVRGRLVGVGVGTIVAVVGMGRTMALFNHLFKDKLLRISGVTEPVMTRI